MKMRRIKLVLILTGIFAGGIVPSLFSQPTQKFPGLQLTVPQESMDFSDLDVRDVNNQPVSNHAAVNQIRQLFIQSLNQMLLENLTPVRRAYLKILSQYWDHTSGLLRNIVKFIYSKLEAFLSHVKFLVRFTMANLGQVSSVSSIHLHVISPLQSLSLLLITSVQILR